MNAKQMIERCREFDRQIKEAHGAACYALTLDEKLDCITRGNTLKEQRREFRKKWIAANPIGY